MADGLWTFGNISTEGYARQHVGNVYTSNFLGQQSQPQKRTKEDYTVGWICALPNPELRASMLLLDEMHDDLRLATRYQYVYGSMNGHNVVMGCSPQLQTGKGAAASIASEMLSTFPALRFGLLVGVAGGVPSKKHDIRLGDVVVSAPEKRYGGVVQYDYGKLIQGQGFVPNGYLSLPPEILLSTLVTVQSTPIASHRSKFQEYVSFYDKEHYEDFPGFPLDDPLEDRLYLPQKIHPKGAEDCSQCGDSDQIVREARKGPTTKVHYGSIATGHELLKDAIRRDEIGERNDILCFEMEAAGIMNVFPCLVVRGICDYCDTHKNKDWQPFAAAAAAAWAKEFLRNLAPEQVRSSAKIGDLTHIGSSTSVGHVVAEQETQLTQKAVTKPAPSRYERVFQGYDSTPQTPVWTEREEPGTEISAYGSRSTQFSGLEQPASVSTPSTSVAMLSLEKTREPENDPGDMQDIQDSEIGQTSDTMLHRPHTTCLDRISKVILARATETRSGKDLTSAAFFVDWDPVAFLIEQYEQDATLGNVIVVVSDSLDAQAALLADYVTQTWPLTGPPLLEALEEWVTLEQSQRIVTFKVPFLNGTLEVSGSPFRITIQAPISQVVEVGGLLSWLCSACRACADPNAQAISRSVLSPFQQIDGSIGFSISSIVSETHDYSQTPQRPEACWRRLFRNICVATDFPVRARANPDIEKGLEIPLDLMLALGGAEQATIFDGQLLIKGYETLFVPVRRTISAVVWHLVMKSIGQKIRRISYNAWKGDAERNVDRTCLYTSRHFLGWTDASSQHAGSQDGSYGSLERRYLPPPESGCVLENVTISASYYLGIGATIKPGNKDKAIRTSNRDVHYATIIDKLTEWPVLLYDIKHERAWMIDGARAALHLLRFQMERRLYRDSGSFDIADFKYANTTNGMDETISALRQNRKMVLLPEEEEDDDTKIKPLTVEKQVKRVIYDAFQQMRDMWKKAKDTPGRVFLPGHNSKLEGWRFGDVVKEEDYIDAVASKVSPNAKYWHRFIRHINAIVLFGTDFGEIIQPSGSVCRISKALPSRQGCLAVSVPFLRRVVEGKGDTRALPIMLAHDLYWHIDKDPFNCTCDSRGSTIHECDRIQEISENRTQWNATLQRTSEEIMHNPKYENAAVIFGKRR